MEIITFSSSLETRYDRHHLIEWWDQNKLKNAKILVAGVGALGNEVLKNLALVGVGNLTLIDFDTISITNLTRSVLFRESDLNFPKVEIAKQRLLEINPELKIEIIKGDLEFDLRLAFVKEHDLIIGCLDSINARWAINQIAYRTGIPWINGGIGASAGEVSFFDPHSDRACYECTISQAMWDKRNQRYSCQGLKKELPEETVPTTAPLASLVSAMQVQQALLYLHRDDSFLQAGEKVFISLQPWTSFKVKIQRQETCNNHDFQVEDTVKIAYQPDLTMKQVLQQIETQGYDDPVLWLRQEILRQMTCLNPDCNLLEIINKPLKTYPESKLTCPHCHQERDLEIVESLALDDDHTEICLEDLCIFTQEILYCETKKGKIRVQFY